MKSMAKTAEGMAFLLTVTVIICWNSCMADVGTATYYSPPYVPSYCYGSDQGQFPAGNLFAAASDAIWDNGAACGRQYSVRCLSGTNQTDDSPCKLDADQSIVVKIVDYCSSDCRGSLELSSDAFGDIASPEAGIINIEYEQV
eukprot:Gb_36587 [translate_table: standard]